MGALDRATRERLVDELCELYPSYVEFDMFLDRRLGRRLADLAAPDALPRVVFAVIRAAQARGWIDELVAGATADSPHSAVLRRLAGPPEPVGARDLEVVVVAPPRWEPLAAAVQADPRVRSVGWSTSVDALRSGLGAADALVVSSEILCGPRRPLLGAVPVVLLETGHPPAPGRTLGHSLAERVTLIVVAGDANGTARRIVDHLEAVAGRAMLTPRARLPRPGDTLTGC